MASIVPELTSNTTPAPWVSSASQDTVNREAWRAFNLDGLPWVAGAPSTLPLILQIQKGGGTMDPASFRFKTANTTFYTYPATFDMQHSSDGVIWTTSDSYSIPETVPKNDWSDVFPIPASGGEEYWRLRVNTLHKIGGVDNLQIQQLEFDDTPVVVIPLDSAATPHEAGALSYTASGTVEVSSAATPHEAGAFTTRLSVPVQQAATPHEAGALSYTASGTVEVSSAATPHEAGVFDSYATPTPSAQSFEIYRAILTGAEDALPDMEVRTDNIQIRRREDNPTFVQAVAADPSQYDDIAARPNGQLIIKAGLFYPETETETLNEIARGDVDRADTSKGAARESLVLVAYGSIPTISPKSVTLTTIDFYSSGTNGQRARGGMESTIRPGDTAVVPSEGAAFVVNEIVYQIGAGLVSMEVQE